MKKKYLLNLYIIINILYIFISSILMTYSVISYKALAIGEMVLLGLNIIVSIILFIKKKYKKSIIDIFLLLIFIFGIISIFFAYSKHNAIFGEEYRYEGIFAITYYLTILFLSSFIKENKKQIIYVILFTGFFQALFGLFQELQLFHVPTIIHEQYIFSTGFTTELNPYGSYMLLSLAYAIGLYIDEIEPKFEYLYLFLTALFFMGVLLSETLSCIVGLVVILGYLFIYTIKKKMFDKLVLLLIVISTTFIFMQKFHMTSIGDEIIESKNETQEMAKGNVKGDFGSSRILIWKNTLIYVPENIFHGIGIDNFRYIKHGHPIIRWYDGIVIHDKAHNEYLQILICEGIFCLLAYLCLYGVITLEAIKYSYKKSSVLLLLPIIGYLTQAFFTFSVIEVAPIFFIALGLSMDRDNEIKFYNDYVKRFFDIIISLIGCILLIPITIVIKICFLLNKDYKTCFYKQKRIGIDGKKFNIYKFRTMYYKADEDLDKLLKKSKYKKEWESHEKLTNDPRITKVGKILRNTNIDELPQMINILKGDMSFIGPRPLVEDELKRHKGNLKKYQSIKPGLTGWWACNKNKAKTYKDRLKLEYFYIDNLSIILDIKCIFKTIKYVLFESKED